MGSRTRASWLLEQEARALLTRLDRVKPFALQETMVPAAGLMPTSQTGIERHLLRDRRALRRRVLEYVAWLRGPGRLATPVEMQRRFSVLKLGFNADLSQLDVFSEAINQRSEAEVGVWLSGLDVAAQDALALQEHFFDSPPIICYLHRGLGGAIRRARTRLPGGGESPVAVIRIPRERMIGHGIASSLVHEVGHQAAALLGLVESLRPTLQEVQRQAPVSERIAWQLWERWISEIVADFWAIAKVGITSTLGLIGIVSLPRPFVFRVDLEDPHPFPFIRVKLSCAIGEALYPHPQWRELSAVWDSFYPTAALDAQRARLLALLLTTMSRFVGLLLRHRPRALRGRSLAEAVQVPDRSPERLLGYWQHWREVPELIRRAPPTLVFAVLGRARVSGRLTPERESRLLGRLITDPRCTGEVRCSVPDAVRRIVKVAASAASAGSRSPGGLVKDFERRATGPLQVGIVHRHLDVDREPCP
jgi:hypothetical protein